MLIASDYGDRAIVNFLPQLRRNRMSYSRINKIQAHIPAGEMYGIKFVTRGCERYMLQDKDFSVTQGNYLLLNKGQDFDVNFTAAAPVHGFCIYLDTEMLHTINNELNTPEEYLVGHAAARTTSLGEFHETVYSCQDILSRYLRDLTQQDAGSFSEADAYDIYQSLACHLLCAQKITLQQIHRLKATKLSTRKELFNRLNNAKAIIDQDPFQRIPVLDLARQAALSEYHFYRSFKRAFGVSPHQYALTRRLEHSLILLQAKKQSITEVAYFTGFNDVFSFSKAFKKHFKIAPSQIRSHHTCLSV